MTGQPWTAPFHWTEENVERLRELWGRGLTGFEISEIFKVTRSKVMGKLNRMGLLDGSRPHTPWGNQRHRESVRKSWAEYKAIARSGVTKPPKSSRGEAGRRAAPQTVAVPPPPPPPQSRPSYWQGVTAEVDVIRMGECRWPTGDPVAMLCKAPTDPRKSYCPYHQHMACKPANAPKEWYEDNPKRIKGTYRQWRPLDMGGSKR